MAADSSPSHAPEEVRKKAARLAKSRRVSALTWRHVASSGVLGFLFVAPVVAGAFLAKWLMGVSDIRSLALLPVALGAVVGGFLVYRQIKTELGGGGDD